MFSFIVLGDTHLAAEAAPSDTYWWNRILVSRSREILRDAVAQINACGVDFAVHCGDLTNDGRACSFQVASEILRGLAPPLYVTPGNHDTREAESRGALDAAFKLDGRPLYRVEHVAGWRMILIDAVHWLLEDGSVADHRVGNAVVNMAVPGEEMNWLREELAADCRTPTLCFLHPFLSVRESYPSERMAGPDSGCSVEMVAGLKRGSLACTAEAKEFLKECDCVKGVFSGHGHWHECLVEDGLLFCQTGALASFPNEMRLVRVSDDHLETEVIGIGGADYPGLSYVEDVGNRWVAGREEDRCICHTF